MDKVVNLTELDPSKVYLVKVDSLMDCTQMQELSDYMKTFGIRGLIVNRDLSIDQFNSPKELRDYLNKCVDFLETEIKG